MQSYRARVKHLSAHHHPTDRSFPLDQHQVVLGLSQEEMTEKEELQRRNERGRNSTEPLFHFTRLQKTEFDEETQRLLTAAEKQNPSFTITDE